jgi:hypothetical protein
MYHGDSPIYYTYKFLRGVLKITPGRNKGMHIPHIQGMIFNREELGAKTYPNFSKFVYDIIQSNGLERYTI